MAGSLFWGNEKSFLKLCSENFGGERGIRTPGGVTLNGFQDRRDRPLRHLSIFLGVFSKNGAKVRISLLTCKFLGENREICW